ncbi:MAG: right-handed parallel beta-helix repeat-containing protein [Thermomicrobiales bacterium]
MRDGDTTVTRGRLRHLADLPPLIAQEGDERIGAATYAINGAECDLTSINALRLGRGIGTGLLTAVEDAAREGGAHGLPLHDEIELLKDCWRPVGATARASISNGVPYTRRECASDARRRRGPAMLIRLILITAISVGTVASPASEGSARQSAPTTYYVSPLGDDTNTGTAPDHAWQTIGRVNEGSYESGDAIRFEGGQTFTGALGFTADNSRGTPDRPVTVSSYGTGRATLAGDASGGLVAFDVAALRITDLIFIGQDATNGATGLGFFNSTGAALESIEIVDVAISTFTTAIFVVAGDAPGRYRDILLERVSVHDNAMGPSIWGYFPAAPEERPDAYGIERLTVRDSEFFRNTGAGLEGGWGAGLFIVNANRVIIEDNRVYDNGGDNPEQTPNGPSAITVYNSRDVLIERNEIWGQRYDLKNQTDNAGIDLWAVNATVQYNHVHDNEGWGMILGSGDGGFGVDWPGQDVTIRYNVFANNGRPLPDTESTHEFLIASIFMFGSPMRYEIYNNTFFRAGSVHNPIHPDFVQGMIYLVDVPGLPSGPWGDIRFRNNVFAAHGDAALVEIARPEAGSGLRFEGNAYILDGEAPLVQWAGVPYGSAAEWSAATGQEVLDGALLAVETDSTALCALDRAGTLADYHLPVGSALIDAGLDLPHVAGLDVGRQDVAGNPIPAQAGYDVGAIEFQSGTICE